jgi:hypothetical protein
MARIEGASLAFNNFTRQAVPEAVRIFEEDRELRRAYNAMRRAKTDEKKEEAAMKHGGIAKLEHWHKEQMAAMDKAITQYRRFFSNLFTDMDEFKKLLMEQVKIDYELRQQRAPADMIDRFAKSDSKSAKRFAVMMRNVTNWSMVLADIKYKI